MVTYLKYISYHYLFAIVHHKSENNGTKQQRDEISTYQHVEGVCPARE